MPVRSVDILRRMYENQTRQLHEQTERLSALRARLNGSTERYQRAVTIHQDLSTKLATIAQVLSEHPTILSDSEKALFREFNRAQNILAASQETMRDVRPLGRVSYVARRLFTGAMRCRSWWPKTRRLRRCGNRKAARRRRTRPRVPWRAPIPRRSRARSRNSTLCAVRVNTHTS